MKNRPVVIGIGCIQQKGNFDDLDEALILMDKAFKKAVDDTTNKKIIDYIDEIQIPKGYWKYRDPARWIANKNGIKSIETSVTKIGILQQSLINSVCKKINVGEISAGVILGGESRYKMLKASKENKKYEETELTINPDRYIKAPSDLNLDIEKKELGEMAVGYYAILESAFRAKTKKTLSEQSEFIANLYSHFSKIASNNEFGWIDEPLQKEEIKKESDKNVLQALPYYKNHCTSWNVNQSCALIICSESIADKLNIPINKRVYPLSSTENNHMIPTLQRQNLTRYIGMEKAANFIIDICKKNNIDVDFYDFYSCFPVAVQMFAESLNVKNIFNVSITGGMPFCGGPLNSFVLHSTAKIISEIRKKKDSAGIVTGVSGMMTKQSYALWSNNSYIDFTHKDFTDEAQLNDKPIDISDLTHGEGKIIGYTILKNKNKPKAIMFLDTNDKKRKLITSNDGTIISSMEREEWVGKIIKFKQNQLV